MCQFRKVNDKVVGVIPDELWSLTYLFNLNLANNYLTGNLSASIGNLTRMQYLGFAVNALSGTVPKELGNLTNLLSLSILRNDFTGSLPSELGNLLKLEQLYIGSSGISGVIPSTFANLRNLEIVWALDTELTGRIDFIGNWSKLMNLKLGGNSFEGPIPSTFSNLTSLTDLIISDLSHGSSSLAFIKDMKSLRSLVLRNNKISDSIPSNIGDYQQLRLLFLGNNKLSGTVPAQKSMSLLNIVLPSGLNCLQRGFPCNRGIGRYYNFSIKCGGPQITSSSGIVYESDIPTENESQELGSASYYVINTGRWAVSNVGYFNGTYNPHYTSSSSSRFSNTLDSELFQTARLSASSLRYYGLGLENGNYTVSLQFAETAFNNSKSWKSLGRRVFNIYIQGNLVVKDFDIRKNASGTSFRAVQIQYNKVQVSENYLEIHLFWAGKGTCCIPDKGTYGPSISALSATPEFIPTVNNRPPSSNKNRTGLIVGLIVGVGILSFLSVFVVIYIVQRRKPPTNDDEELLGIDAKPFIFSYAELKTATEDFNPNNKLGEGGFGPVYKGRLIDGGVIAVKQLSVASQQGNNEFITEIATLSAVQHRNLVKLHGCCIEGDKKLLVYEYLENGCLAQALFRRTRLNLNLSTRYGICLGVARGLAYLHEDSQLRIIHRDMKPSNILLDSNLVPKIADFGFAKLYNDEMTHISTRVAGTFGYLAPEYAMRGHLTEKVDVFGFGVVALEIISGRPNFDKNLVEEEKMYLLDWCYDKSYLSQTWQLYENNREVELVDPTLSEINEEDVKRVIRVSLLCTQASPTLRPSMSRVVAMLLGDTKVGTVTSRPGYLTDWKFDDITSSRSGPSGVKAKETVSIYHDSSESTIMVGHADNSPVNASKLMLGKIIKNPR
nr:putative lrr receptor-like serine/threonine-protein kinase [Quercus suber]